MCIRIACKVLKKAVDALIGNCVFSDYRKTHYVRPQHEGVGSYLLVRSIAIQQTREGYPLYRKQFGHLIMCINNRIMLSRRVHILYNNFY